MRIFANRIIDNMNTEQIYFGTQEQEQTSGSTMEQEAPVFDLVVFNDDVNTFDWVIETLVEVCDHEVTQAEQCAFIVHYKGQCTVKSGDFETLEPMQRELSNRNLSAEVI
jgi:ATP-dependent Clp protease adaptor protein ClpS